MSEEKKKCFVITPIGEEGSPIRRHINGIIRAAIRPALEDKYDVSAAHEHTATGSINNQVITAIYTADLVVANLTTLNPNVMYELAVRHALKKPVIMIMEKGDIKLPFDVINERTIFYTNDAEGVLDLRDKIKIAEENIEINKVSNPIYDALNTYVSDEILIKDIEKKVNEDDANVLKVILNKINTLETLVFNNKYVLNEKNSQVYYNLDRMIEEFDSKYKKILGGYFENSYKDKYRRLEILRGSAIEFYKENYKRMNANQEVQISNFINDLERTLNKIENIISTERKTDKDIKEKSIL